jgi:hypothetical protein
MRFHLVYQIGVRLRTMRVTRGGESLLDVPSPDVRYFASLMRILMISAEGPPLARATALVDVLEALPRELRSRGHEVGIVLPYYREIRENTEAQHTETGITVDVRVGAKTYVAEFLTGRTAGGVQLFYVRCDEFFDRGGIYGEHGVAYEDNAARFIFFSRAALELARRLTPSPQILHAHDWAAALVPVLARETSMPFRTCSRSIISRSRGASGVWTSASRTCRSATSECAGWNISGA